MSISWPMSVCVCVYTCAPAFAFRKYSQGYLWENFKIGHFLGYRNPCLVLWSFSDTKKKNLSYIVWSREPLPQPISFSSGSKTYALLKYKLHKSRACDRVTSVPHNAQYSKWRFSQQNLEMDNRRATSRWILLLFTDVGSFLISQLPMIQWSHSHTGFAVLLAPTANPLTWAEDLGPPKGTPTQNENRPLCGSSCANFSEDESPLTSTQHSSANAPTVGSQKEHWFRGRGPGFWS